MTVNHPDHGELTVGERVAGTRSVTCHRADGLSFVLSSRTLNKLTRPAPVLKPATREEFVTSVQATVDAWDPNEQLILARDLVILGESYL